jgi:hypothetical protein
LIKAPVVTPPENSQINKYYSPDSPDAVKTGIYHDIRGRYSYDSGETDEEGAAILSCYIDVTVQRGPALQ